MKYIYNKLVRDKIPENIDKMEGRKSNYKILEDKEYIEELDKKLFEEAHEFIEEHSVEELADLMEVIYTIMKINNISMNDVENARKIKKDKKGGFNNKIYLIDVEQDQIDEREEKEMEKDWRMENNIKYLEKIADDINSGRAKLEEHKLIEEVEE